jgi:hypothetical protein
MKPAKKTVQKKTVQKKTVQKNRSKKNQNSEVTVVVEVFGQAGLKETLYLAISNPLAERWRLNSIHLIRARHVNGKVRLTAVGPKDLSSVASEELRQHVTTVLTRT